MRYSRILDFNFLLQHRSLFLFGPRQTGKSTLLKELFPQARYFDLLLADTFRELSARPELLRQSLKVDDQLVIIDEVQKLPSLLDEVQALITQRPEIRFILTGSSARKLKRGSANLLAGRALVLRLHPLVSAEVGFTRLHDRCDRGSLPAVLDSPIANEDLRNYIGTYLKEEILAEGLSRGIEEFSRFLEIAALTNGEQINFTAVGSDAGVAPRVVREYYQILEDTLIGFQLPAYRKTIKRKPVSIAKFYFFDVGVSNALMKRGTVLPGSEAFGKALEQLIFLELRAYLDYQRRDIDLSYWRSLSKIEVDFVLGNDIAIEVKAKERISRRDYKGLLALSEELSLKRKIVVCLEIFRRISEEGVEIIPVEEFLRELWTGQIIG